MGRKKKVKSDKINLEEILQNENYKIGNFRRNERGFGFVNIGEEEIFISPKLTKSALDGDNVLIKIFEDKDFENMDKQKREGMVVKIIKHENDTLVGTYKKSRNFGFVIPDNKSVSEDIYIPKKKSAGARNNQKVVVRIDKYADENNKAEGTIVEIIGGIDEAGVDMLSLIKEYRLPNEFPQNVIDEAIAIPQILDESNIQKRVDLRNEEIFTIDGEDAKDLDDAVNVKKNDDGTYTLGVHIADVSYYVKSGSKLDKEAIKRGTSIYMMDRVIPMLPKELSNGICSLNENQDRFTISVIMKIDEKGKVVDSDIFKSVIKTTRRMNYNDVNDIFKYTDVQNNVNELEDSELERVNKVAKKYEPFIEHFARMRELKNILKARRDRNGSLNLDIPESKIILNENGIAVDVKRYDYLESNEVIEQFMLTANETVAEKFYWLQSPFIYRVHEVPDIDKVNELNKFLFNLGYKIRGVKKDDEDSIHPKAFAQVLDEVKGKPEEKVVSNLILRTLKVAKYESENRGHFGIASKCYCHFTSPIRRYPDLFIHRVISSYLKHDYNINDELRKKYEIEAIKYAESSSEREKVAQKVERDAEKIKKAEYMESKIGEVFDGVVSSITAFGMFVELDNTVEGLIRFEYMGNEYFIYDDERKTLTGENSKTVYRVGDEVRIEVIDADKITRNIDFKLYKEE
ncbi:MAG: ribonuclease R [Clostridia bacterium]